MYRRYLHTFCNIIFESSVFRGYQMNVLYQHLHHLFIQPARCVMLVDTCTGAHHPFHDLFLNDFLQSISIIQCWEAAHNIDKAHHIAQLQPYSALSREPGSRPCHRSHHQHLRPSHVIHSTGPHIYHDRLFAIYLSSIARSQQYFQPVSRSPNTCNISGPFLASTNNIPSNIDSSRLRPSKHHMPLDWFFAAMQASIVLKNLLTHLWANWIRESVVRAERFDRNLFVSGMSDNVLKTRHHPFVNVSAAWLRGGACVMSACSGRIYLGLGTVIPALPLRRVVEFYGSCER
jgi:hypothetical protein